MRWPDGRIILICIGYGVGIATLYALWVAGASLIGGSDTLQETNISLGQIVMIYYGGGILVGMFVGLAWPLTRWRVGAALVGYIGAIPFFFAIGTLVRKTDESMSISALWALVLLSSIVGAGAGVSVWSERNPKGGNRSKQ